MTRDEMVETLHGVRRRLNAVLYPGVQVSLIDVSRVIAALQAEAPPPAPLDTVPVSVNRLSDGTIDVFWRDSRRLVNLDLVYNDATWGCNGEAGTVPIHPAEPPPADGNDGGRCPVHPDRSVLCDICGVAREAALPADTAAPMPQIEVGDRVTHGSTPPFCERCPVPGPQTAEQHNKHPENVQAIERNGVTLWRRGSRTP